MKLPNNRDPKPVTAYSWWIAKPREGFTQDAAKLFAERQPTSGRSTGIHIWQHEREGAA